MKGERVDFYQSFLPSDVNFFSEADRFIQSVTFSGPLGDLIPLAIANVIQIPLLVLNPSFLTPFVMICPEGMVPASNVVYLAYNVSGPGHYDALIISQRDQQERFTRGTQRGYTSKPLNIALLNVFKYLNVRYRHIFIP